MNAGKVAVAAELDARVIVRAETSVTGVPSATWSWTVIRPDVVPAVMVCADVPMPSLVGAEVTVNGDTSRSCPSDTTIGTLEGFYSTLGHSHTIVPVQLILPAKL